MRTMMWRSLALLSVLMGAIGAVLPGLPTVAFLLLAAWAGSHGWPELEARLLAHPQHGPVIRRWRERHAVPRKAKWLASGMMLLSAITIQLLPAPELLRVLLPLLLLGIGAWLWQLPDD